MKTVKVKTIRQHVHDGKPRKAGEIYEVPADAASALLTYGWVEAMDSTGAEKGQYETRVMRAKDVDSK